jgi:5,6-dimethylbenzimidazole synthase
MSWGPKTISPILESIEGFKPERANDKVPMNKPTTQAMQEAAPAHDFSDWDRKAFYRVLAARRDMRHFSPGATVSTDVLNRILQASHSAPSVGLMQSWRFIRVLSPALRAAIAELVDLERTATALALGGRSDEFLRLKVEGIRECAELIVAVLAPDDGTVFGRRTMPRDMALCSLACAVQNMWLAARAENLGLGWVSMFEPKALATLLQLPVGAQPMAVLCMGPVPSFYAAPMLEQTGWRKGRPVEDFVHVDSWPGDA